MLQISDFFFANIKIKELLFAELSIFNLEWKNKKPFYYFLTIKNNKTAFL